MSPEERTEKLDALRRYEDARRLHLGNAINLTFGLATAAAGFCISHITNKDAQFSRPGSYFFLAATLAFIVTVALSMLTTWTRLRDFRLTAQKLRRELEGADETELKKLGEQTGRLGKCSWSLFRAQFIAFAVAVLLLAAALGLLYYHHVLPRHGIP